MFGAPATVRLLYVGLVASLVACGEPSDFVVELGVVEFLDHRPLIDVPASASVGVPFQATVDTYGDGCVSFESTDVSVREADADITPYDRRRIPRGDVACTLFLMHIPHEVSLTFASAGNKTVRIHGRKVTTPEPADEIEIAVEILIQ